MKVKAALRHSKFKTRNFRRTRDISFMSAIQRSIQVSYELRVHFTQNVFDAGNSVLRTILAGADSPGVCKVLVILDESLAQSQPGLARQIETYFETHSERLRLVCPPVIIEGGERTKNSYFHVSEIHS